MNQQNCRLFSIHITHDEMDLSDGVATGSIHNWVSMDWYCFEGSYLQYCTHPTLNLYPSPPRPLVWDQTAEYCPGGG